MSKVIFFLSFFILCFNCIEPVSAVASADDYDEILEDKFLMEIYNGNIDSVALFLELGVSPNSTDLLDNSALIYAVQGGYEEIAALLIDAGADINHAGYLGRTPLIEAARFNYFELGELLCLYNAKINIADSYGNTAMHYAVANGDFFFVDMLFYFGAEANLQNNYDATPLHIAAWYGHEEIAGLLIHEGAVVDIRDSRGNTPLIVAALNYDVEMLWYLTESGADILAQNDAAYDALSIAALKRDYYMMDFILGYEVTREEYPDKYKSPAGIAIYYQDNEMKKIIREHEELKPSGLFFTHFLFEPLFNFNNKDFMFGAQAGIIESRYNFALFAGFESRLSPRRVIVEDDENLFLQYWENRRAWFISLKKHHNLFSAENLSFGVSYGIKGAYTYGSYEGSDKSPESKFLAVPFGGIYVGNDWFRIYSEYEYMNTGLNPIPNNRYKISIQFRIPLYNLKYNEAHYYVL